VSKELKGLKLVMLSYSVCWVLHFALPGKSVRGYACGSDDKPLHYKLNGFSVLIAQLALFAIVDGGEGIFAGELYWPCVRMACFLGLFLSLLLFIRGKRLETTLERSSRCMTADQKKRPPADSTEFDARSTPEHFWCGLEWNPRPLLGVDMKMWLYIVGAVQLALVVYSAAVKQYTFRSKQGLSGLSHAMMCYQLCMFFFITEYLLHEQVHLYTYDLIRERTGFKLVWGCFCFYPFAYEMGVWAMVESKEDIGAATAVACLALFFFGWLLTRGANMQKYALKVGREDAQQSFLTAAIVLRFVSLETLPGSNDRILCSGFWGLSRHINYLGETVQALALALPATLATGAIVPMLYPLYYVSLFLPRAQDDDLVCSRKYGAVWTEYKKRVPYAIIPGIY